MKIYIAVPIVWIRATEKSKRVAYSVRTSVMSHAYQVSRTTVGTARARRSTTIENQLIAHAMRCLSQATPNLDAYS